jgi:hypothetical protein
MTGSPFDDAVDDELFDVDAVAAGAWAPGPYGTGDTLGTYNEVTPEVRAAALSLLDLTRPVHTFSLGETLFNGFPAFGDRTYTQTLVVGGYDPGEGFGGQLGRVKPRGKSRMSHHEERVSFSYNLGSKVNGLLHCGADGTYFDGLRGPEIARDHGTAVLDTTTWGPPLCTRGIVFDVVGLLAERGDHGALEDAGGRPVLLGDRRVSIDDLEACAERQGLPARRPGDAVFLHTGWNRMIGHDPQRYLAASPGPHLRELRWLARDRPALVGVDSWMLGSMDPAIHGGTVSAGHQLLLMRYGIRTAEGIKLAELVDAGVDVFVCLHSPLRAVGATASNAPMMALANLD